MEKAMMKKKMRPLTKMEKVLLTILGALIVYFIFFKYVYQPQADRLVALESEKHEYEAKIIENNRILKNEDKIIKEREELGLEREDILDNYFPLLDQSQIIYLIDGLISNKNVNISDLRFARPNIAVMKDMEIAKMDINLPFEGKFSDIVKVLEAIEKSPKRILFSSLQFSKGDTNVLTGSMDLNVLSLEGMVTAEGDVIYVESVDRNTENPFIPYSNYKGPQNEGQEGSSGGNQGTPSTSPSNEKDNEKELGQEILTYPFAKKDYSFNTSNIAMSGIASSYLVDKSDNVQLKLSYEVEDSDEESIGIIDLSSDGIVINEPIDFLKMRIFSYDYIQGEIGLLFKDKNDEHISKLVAESVDWTGWIDKKVELSKGLSNYPLTLDGIYVQSPENRKVSVSFIFDKLEVATKYAFYKVKAGDTVFGISNKFYGSSKYMNEIMHINNINPKEILHIGRVLRLKTYS